MSLICSRTSSGATYPLFFPSSPSFHHSSESWPFKKLQRCPFLLKYASEEQTSAGKQKLSSAGAAAAAAALAALVALAALRQLPVGPIGVCVTGRRMLLVAAAMKRANVAGWSALLVSDVVGEAEAG